MKWLAVLLISASSLSAWAGATSVGDGGHGVRCQTTRSNEIVEPLEMFEAALDGRPLSGDPTSNAMTLFYEALWRVRQRFGLSDVETETLAGVGLKMNSPFCQPYQVPSQTLFIEVETEDPQLSLPLQGAMIENGCTLVNLAERPGPLTTVRFDDLSWLISDSSCPKSLPIILVHPNLYPRLSEFGKAVLTLHEALRFLPLRVRPNTTAEVRALNRSLW